MEKYFYYDRIKNIKKVVLISDKKLDSLGNNYVIAEFDNIDLNKKYVIDEENKVKEEKQETSEERIARLEKALKILIGEK